MACSFINSLKLSDGLTHTVLRSTGSALLTIQPFKGDRKSATKQAKILIIQLNNLGSMITWNVLSRFGVILSIISNPRSSEPGCFQQAIKKEVWATIWDNAGTRRWKRGHDPGEDSPPMTMGVLELSVSFHSRATEQNESKTGQMTTISNNDWTIWRPEWSRVCTSVWALQFQLCNLSLDGYKQLKSAYAMQTNAETWSPYTSLC